jgi:hypothetical protein
MVHAHLDRGVAVRRAQPQQGQRHADVVVQVAFGGQHGGPARFGGQNRGQHFLHRGLAVAAGDGGNLAGMRWHDARRPSRPSACRVSSTTMAG